VALKLLPAAFAADADRLARFRREAQVLASLNHPNIAQIYGIEEAGETRSIVMELVEGETLQARIGNGPIPLDEALAIARQIVEALTPRPWPTVSSDTFPHFLPDGRRFLFTAGVRPFVPPNAAEGEAAVSGQWQVSTAGGIMPVWHADGHELYYLDPEGAMMAVSIAVNGSAVMPGAPVTLFQTRIVFSGVDSQQGPQYDVSRDGRFLVNSQLDDVAAPITLLQNWTPR
jgi:hypothetical protein